jgi:hypothetical protein
MGSYVGGKPFRPLVPKAQWWFVVGDIADFREAIRLGPPTAINGR